MSVFATSVLLVLGLCVLAAVSAWALHWHVSSRAAKQPDGRHTHAFVHRSRS